MAFSYLLPDPLSRFTPRESAKALANVNDFLPETGRNERNWGQIAGLRG